jgi:hypothetical protein
MTGPRRAPAPALRLRLRSGTAARHTISYQSKDKKPDGGWGHFKPSRWGQCKPSRRVVIGSTVLPSRIQDGRGAGHSPCTLARRMNRRGGCAATPAGAGNGLSKAAAGRRAVRGEKAEQPPVAPV